MNGYNPFYPWSLLSILNEKILKFREYGNGLSHVRGSYFFLIVYNALSNNFLEHVLDQLNVLRLVKIISESDNLAFFKVIDKRKIPKFDGFRKDLVVKLTKEFNREIIKRYWIEDEILQDIGKKHNEIVAGEGIYVVILYVKELKDDVEYPIEVDNLHLYQSSFCKRLFLYKKESFVKRAINEVINEFC